MNLCPKCNGEIPTGVRICPNCSHDLAMTVDRSVQDQIRSLLLEGKKIEAIKIYREATGLGLKESKDAVEIVESELRRGEQLPPKTKSGCFALISLILILLYGILRQF
jgi:Ribosomal protein L7/L12 C-terminal domain